MNLHVVIAAGGTAGHVVPALAVADQLSQKGHTVTFIGSDRAEADLVPAAGYKLKSLRVEGIPRRNPLKALRSIGRAGSGVLVARRYLGELSSDVVMGGGGYVAGTVGLAAITRRIPLVLTEADSHLGLANRALAPFAKRVCLAFPSTKHTGPHFVVTGRPVDPPVTNRSAARRRFNLPNDGHCILIFGGSLGARSINQAAPLALERCNCSVIHITGRRDFGKVIAPHGNYRVVEYLDRREFKQALAASDLVVARSGGSIFEIAAHGKPAVLVPYPYASGDHQSSNAQWMAAAGAAVVVSDSRLTGEVLHRTVSDLLNSPARLQKMAAASAELAAVDASARVADQLIEVAGTR